MKITNVHSTLLNLGVNRSLLEQAVQVTLSALMRLISVDAYCKKMKKDFGIVMNTQVFNDTFDNGYYLKHVKLYLAWCVGKKLTDSIDIRRAGRQFELDAKDRQLVNLMKPADHKMVLSKINPEVELYASPKVMDIKIGAAIDSLTDHIGKFTNKKLTFTTKGTGRDKDDVHSDLRIAALRAAYKTYPFQLCDLHLINSMKSAIHNVGINLIQSATTKSRQVMVKEDDEFIMLRENFDFYGSHNDVASVVSSCGLDGGAAMGSGGCSTTDSITYQQLVSQVKGRAAQFLVMLAGHYSERFSAYLRQIGINKDNDEWSQAVLTGRRTSIQRYCEIIADYCKVPHEIANKLLAGYRQQMAVM
ncbi:hypothetical protein Amme1_00217 [Pseudomonas phage vB_PpuM-Amme-1]